MAILEKTERTPNFHKDIETFGNFGEDGFISYITPICKNKNYTIFDVRKIRDYQLVDIDYVIDKENGTELPQIDTVLPNVNRYVKIEVKYNSRALDTGKYAYEEISHGKPGWSIITKCDWVFTVHCAKNKLEVLRLSWINMHKWNDAIKNEYIKGTINIIQNENIKDTLYKISDMERLGIITWIKV